MREFTVYLDEELHRLLTAEHERTGLKKAEIVRTALKAAISGKLATPCKRKKARDKNGRLKEARNYAAEILEGKVPTLHPGRRWKKCPYLFKSAEGKYHCMEKKETFPKCFHGCKAYYPSTRRKPPV